MLNNCNSILNLSCLIFFNNCFIYTEKVSPTPIKKGLNSDMMVGDQPLVERLHKKNLNKGNGKQI